MVRVIVSTREGVFVVGYKTKGAADPGLADAIAPIANAQLNALARRQTSAINVIYDNRQPINALPADLRYLSQGRDRQALPAPAQANYQE